MLTPLIVSLGFSDLPTALFCGGVVERQVRSIKKFKREYHVLSPGSSCSTMLHFIKICDLHFKQNYVNHTMLEYLD